MLNRWSNASPISCKALRSTRRNRSGTCHCSSITYVRRGRLSERDPWPLRQGIADHLPNGWSRGRWPTVNPSGSGRMTDITCPRSNWRWLSTANMALKAPMQEAVFPCVRSKVRTLCICSWRKSTKAPSILTQESKSSPLMRTTSSVSSGRSGV